MSANAVLGREEDRAPLVELTPEVACSLPTVIVVFAVAWSCPSIAMIRRIGSIADDCRCTVDRVPPIAVMDGESERGVLLARHLMIDVLGWGETCWVARGRLVARADVLARDEILRVNTMRLALTWPLPA